MIEGVQHLYKLRPLDERLTPMVSPCAPMLNPRPKIEDWRISLTHSGSSPAPESRIPVPSGGEAIP